MMVHISTTSSSCTSSCNGSWTRNGLFPIKIAEICRRCQFGERSTFSAARRILDMLLLQNSTTSRRLASSTRSHLTKSPIVPHIGLTLVLGTSGSGMQQRLLVLQSITQIRGWLLMPWVLLVHSYYYSCYDARRTTMEIYILLHVARCDASCIGHHLVWNDWGRWWGKHLTHLNSSEQAS